MLPFQPNGHARFSYRAVFADVPYANLSFFDADKAAIPFHLSLRAEGGLAVCNRRAEAPDAWAAEISRRTPLPHSGVDVDIVFEGSAVQVYLDGSPIFRFGRRFLRQFPTLHQIAYVDFQGGILSGSFDIDVQGSDSILPGHLRLNQRLELRGILTPGPDIGALRLTAVGAQLDVPVIDVAIGKGRRAVRAVLPGRVWTDLPPGAPLDIAVEDADTGAQRGNLRVTREALASRISAALSLGPDLSGDTLAAAQIIEHVRFADLHDLLEPAARVAVLSLAAALGLDDMIATPDADTAPLPAPPADPAATDRNAVSTHVARIAQALRDDPGADIGALLEADPPAPKHLLFVCLGLTDTACLRDGFDSLFAAASRLGLPRLETMDNGWANSALLPWLMCQGDHARVPEMIWSLAGNTQDWLMTPPLAWVMRRALVAQTVSEALKEELMYAFIGFIEPRQHLYWERTPCVALMGAMAALLAARNRFADYACDLIETAAVRAFGLSPTFWAMVEAKVAELPQRMVPARDAFHLITAHCEGTEATPQNLEVALDHLTRAGCAQINRLRRDVLGPAGLGTKPLDLHSRDRTALDPDEIALRHLASPHAARDTAPSAAMTEAATRAMVEGYASVPRAPYYRLQLQASRRSAALLGQVRRADPTLTAEALRPLVEDFRMLATPRSHGLGLGLGLSLLAGLLREGAQDLAEALLKQLAPLTDAMAADDGAWLCAHPSLRRARRVLTQHQGNPVADRALALWRVPDGPAPGLTKIPDALRALHDAASPLHDTLVTVFSCRAYLDTRILHLRAGWLRDLKTLGVPYVIVVGDPDGGFGPAGRLDGDVLTLDTPDDYEGLPQKTLATIAWAHRNTRFSHLLKIDDDCLLNAGEFFHSQSHAKFDYYGRPLTRGVGQMDRAWHMAKSSSDRGRHELDKSPEPSTYADGGSGYTLSREAMEAVLSARETPAGRALVQTSFMEDKLLGDLLSLKGIQVAGEDYRITVRRREAPGGLPVPRWVNGFDASRIAPVKLVHLDNGADQAPAYKAITANRLTPKKIWPSYQDAALEGDCNALEMITPLDRLDRARAAPVAVVACMRNEMFMLPHFLDHYRKLGVEAFLVADNCSDDGTLEYLAEQPDVAAFSVNTAYNQSRYGVAWQQALISAFRMGRWTLVADTDELLISHGNGPASLPDLLAGDAFDRADAVRIFMLDMYPKGSLADATFRSGDPFAEAGYVDSTPFLTSAPGNGPYSNQRTWTSALRHRLISGSRSELFVAQKLALLRYRPWMRFSAGLHYAAEVQLADQELLFAHFKYNADFRRKAQAEVARRQHFNDAEEYRKYLALISEGRDVIYDPKVSVPWETCDFVRDRTIGKASQPS